MKQLLEFSPLVLFFTAYQMDGEVLSVGTWSHTFDGIFSATAVLMISSVASWLFASVWKRRNDRRLMWMTIAIIIFGAATLILRDQRFIQWKPTVFNWVLALVFLGSHFIGQRPVLQRLLGGQLAPPGVPLADRRGQRATLREGARKPLPDRPRGRRRLGPPLRVG